MGYLEAMESADKMAAAALVQQAAEFLKSYEEKYYAALEELDNYIAASSGTYVIEPPTGATAGPTETGPKLNTCKLLFPEPLSKSKSLEEFRMWVSTFKRFVNARGLSKFKAATQQGYLLRGLEVDLRKVIERRLTPSMKLFSPDGCLEMLEEEFRILYPIFSCRVDFFQLRQDPGEDSTEYLHRVNATSDMADLEAMPKEDLGSFQFITSCSDKKLRDKLLDLKWLDMTTIKEVVARHSRQLKADTSISKTTTAPIAPIAAMN